MQTTTIMEVGTLAIRMPMASTAGLEQISLAELSFYENTSQQAQAFVYQVTTDANPHLHPDNPGATGPIATRTFTQEKSFQLINRHYGHDDAFYAGSDGFYLGTSQYGIEKYAFDGSFVETIAPAKSDDWVQGLAYDQSSQTWWTAGGNSRNVWKFDENDSASGWTHEFTYLPITGSSHHDGLEALPNGNILFADYAGQIVEYKQNGDYVTQHLHDPFSHELEGMGAGALNHYWAGTHTGSIMEFGGGSLTDPDPIVPVPGALLLSSIGIFTLNCYKRRKHTR